MKTIVITGASDGIGAAAAGILARRNRYRLLLVGRSPDKTHAVARETGGTPFVADFARLDDVRHLADELLKATANSGIDVLANNAGGIFGDQKPTVDGFEKTLQINHLAPFLLTNLVLERLLDSHATVVNTSSIAQAYFSKLDIDELTNASNVSAQRAYGNAKLENILFTRGLHAKFHNQGLSAVAFHPGMVATSFASDSTSPMRYVYTTALSRLFLVSPDKGGANLAWFVEGQPGRTWQPGEYYNERSRHAKLNPQANDAALADELWQRSARAVGLPG